jgi:hypothetical protein
MQSHVLFAVQEGKIEICMFFHKITTKIVNVFVKIFFFILSQLFYALFGSFSLFFLTFFTKFRLLLHTCSQFCNFWLQFRSNFIKLNKWQQFFFETCLNLYVVECITKGKKYFNVKKSSFFIRQHYTQHVWEQQQQ